MNQHAELLRRIKSLRLTRAMQKVTVILIKAYYLLVPQPMEMEASWEPVDRVAMASIYRAKKSMIVPHIREKAQLRAALDPVEPPIKIIMPAWDQLGSVQFSHQLL